MNMKTMNVLIIDPDQAMADAIAAMLAHDLRTRTWQATHASDARWLWERHQPELVIVDPKLPDADGLALCQQMPGNPWIVATSTHSDPEHEAAYLEVADMFLPKPFLPKQLLARLTALARRGKPAVGKDDSGDLIAGPVRMNPQTWTAFLGETRLHLTPIEFKLLAFLIMHPRQTCTYQILLERIWGPGSQSPQKARALLRAQIYNLRRKIGYGLIESVPECGYRFVIHS
jgi:DNA-binding response OmpR family regulator